VGGGGGNKKFLKKRGEKWFKKNFKGKGEKVKLDPLFVREGGWNRGKQNSFGVGGGGEVL